jgi:hypothetical protein
VVASRLLTAAVVVLVLINVGLFYTVLTRDDGSSANRSAVVHATATVTATGVRHSQSPTASPSRESAASGPRHRQSPTATPSRESASSGPRTTPAEATARSHGFDAIVLTRKTYVTKPFRALRVTGTWLTPRPDARGQVRLELRRGAGWSAFPLPAVPDGSGRFVAYINLGPAGRYLLRVVGAGGGPVSAPVVVTVR